MKRNWQLIVFCVIHAFILLMLFRSGIYHNSSLEHDISLFFDYSSKIVGGLLPYQDFTVEYPPLAFVFFTLPRLVASTLNAYQFAFAFEILLFDLLGLFLLSRLSRNLRLHPVFTLAIYTVLLLGIGPIIIYRYDIIPAVMVLACLYAFSRQKYTLSWVILAAAVMTKVYPAAIAPVLLIYQITHRQYREASWGIAAFAITTAILIAPGAFTNFHGFLNSFNMQLQRGLHSETTYSSFLLLGQNLGLTQVSIQTIGPTPLSVNVVSSLASILAKIAPAIMVSALGLIYFLFYRRNRSILELPASSDHLGIANLFNFSFLAILVFMLTNSVFSPQFLIWLYPLVPLVTLRWRNVPWLIFALVCILTYYLFPLNYTSFMQEDPAMINVLLSRNVMLIVLAFLVMGWKQSETVSQNRFISGFAMKPYALALVLIVAVTSILFVQVASNLNILPSDLNNSSETPEQRFHGDRPDNLQHNRFPNFGPGSLQDNRGN